MLAAIAVLAASATLVVPWFEVSIEPANANFDTRITISNTAAELKKARINVWTDRGHPVLYYTTPLESHSSKTISMRDLIVFGRADICANPGMSIPRSLQQMMRCTLTTGCLMDFTTQQGRCARSVGGRHAHAVGYVTIDLVDDCMDLTPPESPEYAARVVHETVLQGSFEQMANGRHFASGPLPERVAGLPRSFKKPRTPRDRAAQSPPLVCPPLAVEPVH